VLSSNDHEISPGFRGSSVSICAGELLASVCVGSLLSSTAVLLQEAKAAAITQISSSIPIRFITADLHILYRWGLSPAWTVSV
jgi:hypothetical protein